MNSKIERIAVVGLGAMGGALAKHLLRAGYRVSGFDPVRERIDELAEAGLLGAKSARDAAAESDLVLLSLRNWSIVQNVVEGEGGILDALRPGHIIADTSTVPPWEARAMAQRLSDRGIEWLDVPISGAANQAREGNMVFMVGGKRTVYERVKPVLDAMGKKTVYVGENGDGAMLKVVVNLTLFLNQAAAIEGLVLGMKAGLDPTTMLEVLTNGAAASDLLSARGRDMVEGKFDPKGPVWLGIKDLGLAVQSAEQIGVALPMAGLYQQLMLAAHYAGWDDEDATVVMRLYERFSATKHDGDHGNADGSGKVRES